MPFFDPFSKLLRPVCVLSSSMKQYIRFGAQYIAVVREDRIHDIYGKHVSIKKNVDQIDIQLLSIQCYYF